MTLALPIPVSTSSDSSDKETLDITKIQIPADRPWGVGAGEAESSCPKITTRDLVDMIEPYIFMPKAEVKRFVDLIFFSILEALAEGRTVHIPNFGTFSMYTRGESHGYNPYVGKKIVVPPRRYMRFRNAHVVRRWLNDSMPAISDTEKLTVLKSRKRDKDQLLSPPFGEHYEPV